MARFRYLKGESFFHRMDPTWKFAWNFLVVGIVILNFDVPYAAAWFVYVFVLAVVVARIPIQQYLRALSFFVAIALFIAFWHSTYYPWGGTALFEWGPIRTTREGLIEGFAAFFRVLVIVSLSIVFTLTTDPGKMVESLIQVARVPYRIGYTMYAALRFIPLYENEAQVVQNAHLVRGVGEAGKSLVSRLKMTWSLMVPLLVSGIRRAQAAAIAMDSRGFGAYSQRTILHPAHVSRATKVFVWAHVALGAVAFYYYVILGHGTHYIG
jgi:energy-coupling factor transport system permease protein